VLPWFSLFATLWGNVWAALLVYRLLRNIAIMRGMLDKTDADIFSPGPSYSLSDFSSSSAIAVVLLTYGLILVVLPEYLFSPIGYFVLAFATLIALTLFFAPLTQIGARRRRSKQKVLNQLAADLRALHIQLHTASRGKTRRANLADLRHKIGALKDMLELVHHMSPWPWQPDSLRNVLSLILLPVLVYLLQRLLGVWLGI
jgi:Flp pilus assembly protein TadB